MMKPVNILIILFVLVLFSQISQRTDTATISVMSCDTKKDMPYGFNVKHYSSESVDSERFATENTSYDYPQNESSDSNPANQSGKLSTYEFIL